MFTASDISEKLAQQVEAVCRELLPDGKMEGGNWCVSSLSGGRGKSLRVQVSGGKAGIWSDFANPGDDKGDLLDLWSAVRGIPLGKAIQEAKAFLRLADPIAHNPPKKYTKPSFKSVTKLKDTKEQTQTLDYLMFERKLHLKTIWDFRIAEFDHPVIGKAIVFPSKSGDPDGDWIAAKYIALKRDEKGKKVILNEKDQAPALFGWQAAEPGNRRAIITEGQIDAMTWYQWLDGQPISALSIPNGTGDIENWIDYEWDNLSQFDTIYLSFDMDDAGRRAVQVVARRLGIHRCMIVKLPHNDANECLQKGCGAEEASRWLMEAKPMQPAEIKAPIEFRERILAAETPDMTGKRPGFCFSVMGDKLRFLPGEVTLWTGYSFHGKSTLLNQLALESAIAGERVAIGSFEMRGELTCAKLAKCLAFTDAIAPVLDHCLGWMGGKIWIYDVHGIITQAKLFELMLYSVMRHGVDQIVIDSLMKCDVSSEDYEGQRQLLNKIIDFAHSHEVHIHIVAHPKKSDDDKSAPDIMDVHGGQAVSGQPDNIVSVWKNSKKADKREDGTLPGSEEIKHPDSVAYIRKNRADGNRYKVNLWFRRHVFRFTDKLDMLEDKPSFRDYGIIKLPPDPQI